MLTTVPLKKTPANNIDQNFLKISSKPAGYAYAYVSKLKQP